MSSKHFTVGNLYIAKYKTENYDTGDIMMAVSETELLHGNQKVKCGPWWDGFEEVKFTDKLEGKSICITGALDWPREFYKKVIEMNGGKFATSVTKNLSFLICDQHNFMSSKITKAKELNIPIIKFKDFMNMLK